MSYSLQRRNAKHESSGSCTRNVSFQISGESCHGVNIQFSTSRAPTLLIPLPLPHFQELHRRQALALVYRPPVDCRIGRSRLSGLIHCTTHNLHICCTPLAIVPPPPPCVHPQRIWHCVSVTITVPSLGLSYSDRFARQSQRIIIRNPKLPLRQSYHIQVVRRRTNTLLLSAWLSWMARCLGRGWIRRAHSCRHLPTPPCVGLTHARHPPLESIAPCVFYFFFSHCLELLYGDLYWGSCETISAYVHCSCSPCVPNPSVCPQQRALTY